MLPNPLRDWLAPRRDAKLRRRPRLELESLEGRLAPAATQLAFEATLSPLTAGPIPTFKVDVDDNTGHIDTTSSAAVTVAVTGPGGFAAGGVTMLSATSGVATFSGLALDTAGTYTITATSPGLTSASQNNLAVNAGAAKTVVLDPNAKLAATAGQPIASFNVFVHDGFGNPVTTGSVPVTVGVTGPGPLIAGAAMVQASSGTATFSGLVLNAAGSYTLTFSSPGLTSATTPLTVALGPPSKLAFAATPATTVAGLTLPAFSVGVVDAGGNPLDGVIVAIRANGPGNFAAGFPAVVSAGGMSTFSGLVLRKAGTYTFTASASDGAMITSSPFVIQPASPTHLAFTVGPAGINAGQSLRTLTVAVEDRFNNIVTASTAAVTIVANGTGGLTGTTTRAALRGVATFTHLVVQVPGTYTLTASASGLKSTNTKSFVVKPVAAFLQLFGVPAQAQTGRPLPLIQVQLLDILGHPFAHAGTSVTLHLPHSAGTHVARTNASGVASFNGLVVHKAGVYVVVATSSGLQEATSNILTVRSNAAALRFLTEPHQARRHGLLAPVQVQLVDALGNSVAQAGVKITLHLTLGRLTGIVTRRTDSSGVATFTGLHIPRPGRYTLRANARGMSSGFSTRFSVTPK
jgi:hypothetical protein